MAHIDTGGGGRSKTTSVNLVPFIDLMSVLITFLLLTAVWTQVSIIQIGSSIYGKQTNPSDPKPEMPPQVEVVLKVDVKPSGYVLTIGKQMLSLPLLNGLFDDEGLVSQLKRVKQLYPDKQDAILSVSDELEYEKLIAAMDGLLKSGFPQIAVATGDPK